MDGSRGLKRFGLWALAVLSGLATVWPARWGWLGILVMGVTAYALGRLEYGAAPPSRTAPILVLAAAWPPVLLAALFLVGLLAWLGLTFAPPEKIQHAFGLVAQRLAGLLAAQIAGLAAAKKTLEADPG